MTEQKKIQKMPHDIVMNNCEKLSMTGIKEVGSFDDRVINCFTDIGELIIKGENLHIENMNTQSGDMDITGRVTSLVYTDEIGRPTFFSKLFR